MVVKVLVTVEVTRTDDESENAPHCRHTMAHSAVAAVENAVRLQESNGFRHPLEEATSIRVVRTDLHWVD